MKTFGNPAALARTPQTNQIGIRMSTVAWSIVESMGRYSVIGGYGGFWPTTVGWAVVWMQLFCRR